MANRVLKIFFLRKYGIRITSFLLCRAQGKRTLHVCIPYFNFTKRCAICIRLRWGIFTTKVKDIWRATMFLLHCQLFVFTVVSTNILLTGSINHKQTVIGFLHVSSKTSPYPGVVRELPCPFFKGLKNLK